MKRERRNQRHHAVPLLRAQPCLPWTPRICRAPNKKKDEVNWAWIEEAEVEARPLVPHHVAIVSHLNSDRGG
jgi:hypothetical protein